MSQKSVPKKGYKKVPWYYQKEIEIPEEWDTETLGSTCDQIQDMDHKMPEKISKGIPFLSISDIVNKSEIDFSNQKYISKEDYSKFSKKLQPKKNDLLYSRVATIGESRIIREEKRFAFTYNVVLIKTGKKIKSLFLKYVLDFPIIKNRVKSIAPQGAYPFLGLGDIEKISIIVPPLPEQQKIVSILSNVDNLIQNIDKTIHQTKLLKKGLMQKLLTKGISHAKSYKPLMLNSHSIIKADDYSVDWNFFALGDPESGFFSNGVNKNKEDYGHGCLFVNISDVFREFTIDSEKLKRVEVSKDEIKKYGLQKDDIILDRSSNIFETVGYPAYFAGSNKPVVFSGFTFRYRPNPKIWNSKFLTYQLMSYPIRKLVISISTKSANSNVNQNSYKKILIPNPNLPEQQKIVSILSNTDEKIQSYGRYKEKLQRVKKSLMQKLLTGEVRVAV